MLLSEVALGEVHELKKAKYLEKPPEGKHSTKGFSKKIPQKSECVNCRDDVIVPCGKPVPSNIKASELMYNEYIVFNTAQVLDFAHSCVEELLFPVLLLTCLQLYRVATYK